MIDAIFSVLRTSEWLNLGICIFFLVVSWLRPMSIRRRLEVTGLGVVGSGLTLAVAFGSQGESFSLVTIARDLLPAPLMLLPYWQAGRFSVIPNERIQQTLLRLDEIWIGPILYPQENRGGKRVVPGWLANYLEFAYLLCYPMVPLGVGVLYLAGAQDSADRYWTVAQSSTYLCYLPLPFIQMLPPRLLLSDKPQLVQLRALRLLNLKILKHASIQVNTFPSAHVASTSAAALALLCSVPAAGVIFLILALSIAGGAVLGRYHYLADVALGIVFSVLIWLL